MGVAVGSGVIAVDDVVEPSSLSSTPPVRVPQLETAPCSTPRQVFCSFTSHSIIASVGLSKTCIAISASS